jgi:hypothetical protein
MLFATNAVAVPQQQSLAFWRFGGSQWFAAKKTLIATGRTRMHVRLVARLGALAFRRCRLLKE